MVVKSLIKTEGISLKQNMFWNSFGSMIYLGCQWLITVLVVRISNGYDAAGALALAMSVYNTFSPLALYRMYTYQVSDVSHENTVGEYLSFRMITSCIAFALIIVYSVITCPPDSWLVIFAFSLYKIASLLIDVLHGLDQQHKHMDYVGRSLALQGLASIVIFCVAEFVFQMLVVTLLLMSLGVILIGLLYDLPRSRRFERISLGISRRKTLHLLGYCLPIVIGAIACGAAPSIPRQVLAYYDGQAALGIYASVAAPVTIIQMGASYIYNPLLGYFSDAYAKRDMKHLALLHGKACVGIILLGLVSAFVLELVGQQLLSLMYGESITSYVYLMLPIIACSLVTAYVWFLNDILVAFRNFKGSVIGNVIAVTLSVPAALLLIPIFGMNGVSFAHFVSYGTSALVMLVSLVALFRRPAERQNS